MTVTAATEAVASAPVCSACGATVAPGDLFCEACGHELPAVPGAAPAPAEPDPAVAAVPGPTCAACGTADAFVDGWCRVCGRKQPSPRDHIEVDLVAVAGVTDKGIRHHRNEDAMALVVGPDTTHVVAVVCDGVSTTVRPDDASQGAVDAAAAVLAATASTPDHVAAYDAARSAVLAVDFVPDPKLGSPSCTYLAAHVTDTAISVAFLGDCRAYWRDAEGVVTQLTVDDSWATQQVLAGAMTAEVAYTDPRAHSITAWLGRDADPAWTPATVDVDPTGGGRLLLVSDGLWNYAPTNDAVAALLAAGDPEPLATARRLVEHANASGGADNITVAVVDVPLRKGTAPA